MKSWSRADTFLDVYEGFKLGSLGVSKVPKVTPPLQAGERTSIPVKILKQGTEAKNGNPLTGSNSYPYIYWQDQDDWCYALTMDEGIVKSVQRYSIYLKGGPNLTIEINDGVALFNGQKLEIITRTLYTQEHVFPLYDDLVSVIKSQGVEGLIRKKLLNKFKGFGGYSNVFDLWIEERNIQFGINK